MKTVLLTLISISTFLSSCELNVVDNGNKQEDDIDLKNANQVIEASNEFGFEIFADILESEEDARNVFISPTSISLALAMAWNGADGNTREQMAQTLKMDHLSDSLINVTYRDLIAALTTADEKVLLEIANSIWYHETFPVKEDFLEINSEYYNAEVEDLNFAEQSSVDIINEWVSDKTHEKIKTILDQLSADARMVLINAIYFKGSWKIDFNEENTQAAPFIKSDNEQVTVDMMNMEEVIGYYQHDDFQMCELDYGDGSYSMVVMLPTYGNTVQTLLSQLSNENWKTWLGEIDSSKVKLFLPKFKFGYEKKLNDILKAMGMPDAFSAGAANFSGISDIPLFISLVKHKSFVEVNEEGTEAAAVTAIVFEISGAIGEPDPVMNINRPFLFAIRDKTTNALVFMGKVNNPLDEGN